MLTKMPSSFRSIFVCIYIACNARVHTSSFSPISSPIGTAVGNGVSAVRMAPGSPMSAVVASLRDENAALKAQNTEKEARISSLEAEVFRKNDEIASRDFLLNEHEGVDGELRQACRNKNEQISRLQAMLETAETGRAVRADRGADRAEVEALRTELNKVRTELGTVREKYGAAMNALKFANFSINDIKREGAKAGDVCAFCLQGETADERLMTAVVTPCGHQWHKDCLEDSRDSRKGLCHCRTKIVESVVFENDDGSMNRN